MRFQIMHESPGRMRLRADLRSMSLEQADILEAWILSLPGVERAAVHERTLGVVIFYRGDRKELCRRLSGFSFEGAGKTLDPQVRSSREMNRAYKEKLVFLVTVSRLSAMDVLVNSLLTRFSSVLSII